MDLVAKPSDELTGKVTPNPSKFYTQFAIIAGLLAEGGSKIEEPLLVDDTRSLIKAVEEFGAETKRKKKEWTVWGTGESLVPQGQVVDAKKTMTGLSLLAPLTALIPRVMIVTGATKVRSRPVPTLINALQNLGTDVNSVNSDDCPPLVSFGRQISGGGDFSLPDDMNPRFVPAAIVLLPLMEEKTSLEIPNHCRNDFLNIALEILTQCGIDYDLDDSKLEVEPQKYESFETTVPPDIFLSLPFVVGAILTDSELEVDRSEKLRNLEEFSEILDNFEIDLAMEEDRILLDGSQVPSGGEISLYRHPELLPFLAVLSLKADGEVRIVEAERARNMKSDRISAMVEGLNSMNVSVEELEDGLVIDPTDVVEGTKVDGLRDEVVVAALGIAGLIADGEMVVKNRAETLRESYPHFVSVFNDLGADMSYGS
ncbi:MAG: 3-phosphoshikimate 1-carboxyvinyltransferase [Candidatus Hadarchaeia archaeon]